MKKSLIIVLLTLCSTPCFAYDGNELLEVCEVKKGSSTYYQDDAYCSGYITGAAHAYSNSDMICVGEIGYGQSQKVVLKYLRNNPELLHQYADVLVKNALAEAFPCK